ncbi:MAG: peptidylprolyl isomerase [Candidatus Cloacimonetes bacterium]|nr:peptidylprolyl isomerase [Candidatus Cloacimonadota bacterium]
MLNKMRAMSKPIIWIIAIVFIGGMGTMGIGEIFKTKYHVGVIDGKKIKYEEYYKMLQNSYTNYIENSEDKEIDEATYRQLNDQTWDQLVQSIILGKAIKNFDIKVSSREVANKMLNDPPEVVLQHEGFQTDGSFDMNKYTEALRNPNIDWTWLENYYYQILLYEKLQNIIKSVIIVTDYEVKKDYIERNTKAKADVIVFSTDMTDSVDVTETEIEEYYHTNRENFKTEPQRKLKYVKIPLLPSPADSKGAKDRIERIYKMVMGGEDFAELAEEYSECPSASKGGDLDFFGKGMMAPAFEEKAFAMQKEEVSEPFQTQFGWHIIKLTDIRTTDEEKEVRASHILIKEQPGAETRRNLEKIAFDFYEQCQTDSFEVVAKQFNYEVQETPEFQSDERYIPGLGRAKTLLDFAYLNKLYDVAQPYRTETGDYYVAMISYKIGEHFQDLETVRERVVSDIEHNKKMTLLASKVDSIVAIINSDNFHQVAENNKLKVVNTRLISKDAHIKDIGREEKLNQAILSLMEVGKISDLIKGKKGYYLAQLVEFQPADMQKFEQEKNELKDKMITREENQAYNEWYNKIKEDANIKDWRSKFFRM